MKFRDHPIGAEFEREITFTENNLQIIIQYKFAWKDKTTVSLFFRISLIKRNIDSKYFNLLFNLSKKS